MSQVNILEGHLPLKRAARFGVIVSRFNSFIVDNLQTACVATLREQGVADEDITVVKVPGAYEIPMTARRMAMNGDFDIIIALGAVIRGETAHFDYVAGECARGISEVSADLDVPVIFGVLTTDTVQQAADRAGGKAGNKGADCAKAAIEMVDILRQLSK